MFLLEAPMAVNKPTGDNARKGAVKKRSQLEPADEDIDQAQQGGRPVHGCQEKREKVQGCAAREIMRRFFPAVGP